MCIPSYPASLPSPHSPNYIFPGNAGDQSPNPGHPPLNKNYFLPHSAHSSIIKIDTVYSSRIFITTYKTTKHHNPHPHPKTAILINILGFLFTAPACGSNWETTG
jgi:hypothetical protein